MPMTDRPRAWTLYNVLFDQGMIGTDCEDQLPRQGVRVVEWDREKVEAAMVKAMTDAIQSGNDADYWALARAIFDALDPEGP